MISSAKLIVAWPKASAPWLTAIVEVMPKWGILGIKREAAFLAQIYHESGGFLHFVENLNYSDPERIARIFRTAFDLDKDKIVDPEEIEFARKYVKNPEALANRAYAERYGNGSESSGDGYKYRGRGPLQTTFKKNYEVASFWTSVNLVLDPDEMLVPRVGCAAACGYWKDHGCNELADYGNHKEITRQINPGLAGLMERTALIEPITRILEQP